MDRHGWVWGGGGGGGWGGSGGMRWWRKREGEERKRGGRTQKAMLDEKQLIMRQYPWIHACILISGRKILWELRSKISCGWDSIPTKWQTLVYLCGLSRYLKEALEQFSLASTKGRNRFLSDNDISVSVHVCLFIPLYKETPSWNKDISELSLILYYMYIHVCTHNICTCICKYPCLHNECILCCKNALFYIFRHHVWKGQRSTHPKEPSYSDFDGRKGT